MICISNRHKYDQKLWDLATFVLLYLLPLSIMAFLYARIGAALWGSGRRLGRLVAMGPGVHGVAGAAGSQHPRARRSVVKLTVTVVSGLWPRRRPLNS